jgi:ribosomal protein S18 acetylase RimI-like enzyme
VLIRDAVPAEFGVVGELRVAAYLAGQHLSPDSGYAPRLRELGADGLGDVLVAVDQAVAQPIIGTIMLQYWPDGGELVTGPDEAGIRALAVAPAGQGRGVGRALLQAIIARAQGRAIRHLVLYTQPDMVTAQRLYQQAGFVRLPDRDRVQPEYSLLAYGLRLETA